MKAKLGRRVRKPALSIDPPAKPGAALYRRRASVLEAEREYRVEPQHLVVHEPGAMERRLPWADVRSVRLGFAPTEQKLGRYLMALDFASGERLELDNMHWRGFGDFEDRSEAYRGFVERALERIRAQSPDVAAYAGASAPSYFGQIALLAGSFALLGWALSLVTSWERYGHLITAAGLLTALPVALAWMVMSRPRRLDIRDPSWTVLPRGPEET